MIHQRTRTTFRPAARRTRREPAAKDPYLIILTAQIVVCIILITVSWASGKINLPFMEEISQKFKFLIMEETVEFPVSLKLPDYDTVVQTAAGYLEKISRWPELLGLKKAENSAEEEKILGHAELTGAGGWMGLGKEEMKSPPSSCELSPIRLSAGIQPPTSGKVTSFYGYRKHPITESPDFHRGVDIATVKGSGIYLPLPGQVSEVDVSSVYGNYVTIDHGGGLQTTYCHCETILVQTGTNLRRGEKIATVGSTGISTGPHVHFEISKDGVYYNPAWVLSGMSGYGI
ncbi:M23 family metallopeptidase [Youxingia wuxianensis]|uniref:M23 family metallopeptidase n=1 Tax=Youxingia wuxianensis TaxID=2763678 RepID=A0A926EK55_9FIRM|nr:M23 family metallopeptidase [Youxingia wuxianensis]MBC8584051.1 M23 family metallopeptidase [Youxingia wuxianensis]